jgi:ADP-heptose:LPS heptosyltransferase
MLERIVHVGAELANEGDIATEIARAAAQCDLVVSVDSPVAHTAALLGRPTLVLVDGSEEFPWPLDRIETAWYPTLGVLVRHAADDDGTYARRIQQAIDAFADSTRAAG